MWDFIFDLIWGASEIFFSKETDEKQEEDEYHAYRQREYGQTHDRRGDDLIDRDRFGG